MKKAKIMLTAVAVLAVVGTGLAFKVKKFNTDFCTRAFSSGSGTCQGTLHGKIDAATGTEFFYTISDGTHACTAQNCPSDDFLTTNEN